MEREFDFPVEPYDVQLEFMTNLYDCLSSCKVGIFESPTGTGKSLSIICSAFKWLREYKGFNTIDPQFEGSQSWVNEIPSEDPPVLKEINNIKDNKKPQQKDQTCNENLKIVYISRTHSQLDQFLNEIKKTKWNNDIKIVRLGSRNQLCVNPELSGLKNRGIIDYKCKELINPNNTNTCPYFKGINFLRDHMLQKVCDIEDLVLIGKKQVSCPYFASRSSIPLAEVIIAPYTLALNKKNRDSIGLDLKNTILIIDEAHNIIEAMIDCYSASLTKAQAESSLIGITEYHQRFGAKIGARSSMYFEQILNLLRSILSFMESNCSNLKKTGSIGVGEFLIETKLERIDFYKIYAFADEIELSRKVIALSEKSGNRACISSFPIFLEFLRALCDDISFGKILINANEEAGIKYLLLNPTKKFEELVSEARCVILAGGTMEPKQEYLDLFISVPKSSIKLFNCKHVMPSSNLLLGVVSKGESGCEFRFTYDNRDNQRLMADLAALLVQVSIEVPNGIVVFLPSYFFLSKLKFYLEKSKQCDVIKKHKKLFFDNKDENILEMYSQSARNSGAMLFAVVRGKLSEGINFSDYLGRCVLMIGMPYLNKTDLEIQERMKYLDSTRAAFNGKMFYESSCHKAINQSIGRAIRHKNDYAVILLVDERHQASLQRRPEWMLGNMIVKNSSLQSAIRAFFSNK
jgi:chromosome transmission fidelity protein 1